VKTAHLQNYQQGGESRCKLEDESGDKAPHSKGDALG